MKDREALVELAMLVLEEYPGDNLQDILEMFSPPPMVTREQAIVAVDRLLAPRCGPEAFRTPEFMAKITATLNEVLDGHGIDDGTTAAYERLIGELRLAFMDLLESTL